MRQSRALGVANHQQQPDGAAPLLTLALSASEGRPCSTTLIISPGWPAPDHSGLRQAKEEWTRIPMTHSVDPANRWPLHGDPKRLTAAAAVLRAGDAEQIFGTRFPGEYVMTSVARLLEAVAIKVHEHVDLGHDVMSAATEIAEHVLAYVPRDTDPATVAEDRRSVMLIRVATTRADIPRTGEGIASVRGEIEPKVSAMDGNDGFAMAVDHSSRRYVGSPHGPTLKRSTPANMMLRF